MFPSVLSLKFALTMWFNWRLVHAFIMMRAVPNVKISLHVPGSTETAWRRSQTMICGRHKRQDLLSAWLHWNEFAGPKLWPDGNRVHDLFICLTLRSGLCIYLPSGAKRQPSNRDFPQTQVQWSATWVENLRTEEEIQVPQTLEQLYPWHKCFPSYLL